MKAETIERLHKLSLLYEMLENHDWYYHMADDHTAYERGKRQYLAIKDLTEEIGAQKMLEAYVRWRQCKADDKPAFPSTPGDLRHWTGTC